MQTLSCVSYGTKREALDEIESGVFAVIGSTFKCDPSLVTRATTADDIDGWDSLSHTVLLVGIERHFDIRLDHEEVLDLADVGGLVDAVARTVHAKAATDL
jgi:acyl carrier protein